MKKFILDAKTKKIPYSDYGYNQVSVDKFIDEIIQKFEILLEENDRLKIIEEKFKKAEETIKKQQQALKYFKSMHSEEEIFDLVEEDEE